MGPMIVPVLLVLSATLFLTGLLAGVRLCDHSTRRVLGEMAHLRRELGEARRQVANDDSGGDP